MMINSQINNYFWYSLFWIGSQLGDEGFYALFFRWVKSCEIVLEYFTLKYVYISLNIFDIWYMFIDSFPRLYCFVVVSFWFWNIDGAVGRRVILIWNLIMYIGQAFKDIIRSKIMWSYCVMLLLLFLLSLP